MGVREFASHITRNKTGLNRLFISLLFPSFDIIRKKKRTRIVAERRNAKAAGIPKAQIPDPIPNPSREVKGTTAERLRAAGKTLVQRRRWLLRVESAAWKWIVVEIRTLLRPDEVPTPVHDPTCHLRHHEEEEEEMIVVGLLVGPVAEEKVVVVVVVEEALLAVPVKTLWTRWIPPHIRTFHVANGAMVCQRRPRKPRLASTRPLPASCSR